MRTRYHPGGPHARRVLVVDHVQRGSLLLESCTGYLTRTYLKIA
jgi:hypothetical protein